MRHSWLEAPSTHRRRQNGSLLGAVGRRFLARWARGISSKTPPAASPRQQRTPSLCGQVPASCWGFCRLAGAVDVGMGVGMSPSVLPTQPPVLQACPVLRQLSPVLSHAQLSLPFTALTMLF